MAALSHPILIRIVLQETVWEYYSGMLQRLACLEAKSA